MAMLLTTCTIKPNSLCTQQGILDYILSYGNSTVDTALRVTHLIIKHSDQYDIPRDDVTRLSGTESEFKRYAFNSGSGARGYGQIIDKHWRYGLYDIDNKKLGKYLKKHNITNIDRLKRYYYRNGYAIELMCFAISACRKHKRGDLWKGIYMYGGGYAEGADQEHMTNYMRVVMGD